MSNEWKRKLKKVWHFIWEDESMASWIANVVIAFVLIRFVIYPFLSFAFGTPLPIVAVVSGSMEHKIQTDYTLTPNICGLTFDKDRNLDFDAYWELCGEWYEQNTNITKEMFAEYPFVNGFNKGDIMFLRSGNKPQSVEQGDVIVFIAREGSPPIIHRVVEVRNEEDGIHYTTKGDHNARVHSEIREGDIHQERYLGKAFLRLPYLGWIKITAVCAYKKVAGMVDFGYCMKY